MNKPQDLPRLTEGDLGWSRLISGWSSLVYMNTTKWPNLHWKDVRNAYFYTLSLKVIFRMVFIIVTNRNTYITIGAAITNKLVHNSCDIFQHLPLTTAHHPTPHTPHTHTHTHTHTFHHMNRRGVFRTVFKI